MHPHHLAYLFPAKLVSYLLLKQNHSPHIHSIILVFFITIDSAIKKRMFLVDIYPTHESNAWCSMIILA